MRAAPLQNSFLTGEISPLVLGRVDIDRYSRALLTCLNYIPILQGPLTRRPGTKFVAEVKDSSKETRLVSFEFSTTQAYILEFGDKYIRFYREQGQIVESDVNIDNVTQANPAEVTTATAHGYSTGDAVRISNVDGMTSINGGPYQITKVSSTKFTLDGVDSTGFDAYSASADDVVARVHEISTPYAEADLFQLKFTQSADVLYIVHPDYEPRKLSRTGHTSWTLEKIEFQDGPYLAINKTSTTLTPSGTSGSITITASATTGINNDDGFKSTDVGRLIRFKDSGNNWTWLEITAHTSTTQVTAEVKGDALASTSASSDWRLGVWSETTGFPACTTFYEDRLSFAGATEHPQRVDMSESGSYEFFAPTEKDGTVTDASAIAFTVSANQVNVVRWMANDDKGLLLGTVGGEWIVRSSVTGEALTPTNVNAKKSTSWGSENIQEVQVSRSTIFVQRSGRNLREVNYFFDADGYRAIDLSVLAEHLTAGGFVELSIITTPHPIVWAVRKDGVLLGMTYQRSDDSFNAAWHRHEIGGVSDANGTHAKVESVSVIPSPDGTRQDTWLLVQRHVNGATVRHIEYMTKFFEAGDSQNSQFFVDSGLSYDGVATTTLSGLGHLEGETVKILADGAVVPEKTVSGGSITLDDPAEVVSIGLGYSSKGEMPRIEAGSADGTALGKTRRIHRLGFLFWRTLGFKFGQEFSEVKSIIFRKASDNLGEPTPLFTGIKSETVEFDYDFENTVCWQQDDPVNGVLLAVMPQMRTEDRG